MTTPIQTLIHLNHRELVLDMIQSWIDAARTDTPMTHEIQLELDQQQADIDEQREGIAFLRRYISMNN